MTQQWIRELFPKNLPQNWRLIDEFDDGARWCRFDRLTVILKGIVAPTKHRWLTVACAFPSRSATWNELRNVKTWFIGEERMAVMVMAPRAWSLYQGNPFALHLVHCIDGPMVIDSIEDLTSRDKS